MKRSFLALALCALAGSALARPIGRGIGALQSKACSSVAMKR